ncbi:MAG TPA: ribonuclease HI family protein [Patescibacteria group bacterium]|nr:ribonuclease HI family protein [Patescibacteria group bacterium]
MKMLKENDDLAEKDVNNTSIETEYMLFTDGGSRGNPGPSATAFVVFDMTDKIIKKDGTYIGDSTNNQAEYQAVKQGLSYLNQIGARVVHVYMDSLLVVNQMKGTYKIKNPDLFKVKKEVDKLIEGLESVDFVHIPREMNRIADEKVNNVLDSNGQ